MFVTFVLFLKMLEISSMCLIQRDRISQADIRIFSTVCSLESDLRSSFKNNPV